MEYYWKDELVKRTKSINQIKITFTDNLAAFAINFKEPIKDCFAIKKENETRYYKLVDYNGNEWRQIDGIGCKEDLEVLLNMKFDGKLIIKNPYRQLCSSITKTALNWANKTFTDKNDNGLFKFKEKDLCYDDLDLYLGFCATYKAGYSFNNTENKVYKNVYSYDIKSCFSAVMYKEKFPISFRRVEDNIQKEIKNNSYFGKFFIEFKRKDDFLYKMFYLNYNENCNAAIGFINDVDYKFLDELVGIKSISPCGPVWVVETDYLPVKVRNMIANLYFWKETCKEAEKNETDSEKKKILKGTLKFIKLALERLYGECIKSRFYDKNCIWNEEEQKIEINENDFDFEEIKESLKDAPQYCWGVWTCSYVRLQLVELKNKMGDDALYGDIDSIKFRKFKNLSVVKEFNERVEKEIKNSDCGFNQKLTLGQLENDADGGELYLEFKALEGLKWYCGRTLTDLTVKCSGATPQIVKDYLLSLKNPVENFSKVFPENIKPYRQFVFKDKEVVEIYSNKNLEGF